MTRLPEIWKCMKNHVPNGQWIDLHDIYKIISSSCVKFKQFINSELNTNVFTVVNYFFFVC